MNIAIILFGGNGTRFGYDLPKQFYNLKNHPLCYYSIKSFNDCSKIDSIALVIDNKYLNKYKSICDQYHFNKVKYYISGGDNRQKSSFNGLTYLKEFLNKDDNVLIHDGDRLIVDEQIIINNIEQLNNYNGVVTAIKSEDTIAIGNNKIEKYLPREKIFRIQTPQSFKYGVILCAHQKYQNELFTDDASMIIKDNIDIGIVEGNKKLTKITTKEDIDFIKDYLYE